MFLCTTGLSLSMLCMLRTTTGTSGLAAAHCLRHQFCGPLQELLGDGLHPTAKGLMTIAQCLMPLVNKLAGSNNTASHAAASNATAHASFQVQGTHQQVHDLLRQLACALRVSR